MYVIQVVKVYSGLNGDLRTFKSTASCPYSGIPCNHGLSIGLLEALLGGRAPARPALPAPAPQRAEGTSFSMWGPGALLPSAPAVHSLRTSRDTGGALLSQEPVLCTSSVAAEPSHQLSEGRVPCLGLQGTEMVCPLPGPGGVAGVAGSAEDVSGEERRGRRVSAEFERPRGRGGLRAGGQHRPASRGRTEVQGVRTGPDETVLFRLLLSEHPARGLARSGSSLWFVKVGVSQGGCEP